MERKRKTVYELRRELSPARYFRAIAQAIIASIVMMRHSLQPTERNKTMRPATNSGVSCRRVRTKAIMRSRARTEKPIRASWALQWRVTLRSLQEAMKQATNDMEREIIVADMITPISQKGFRLFFHFFTTREKSEVRETIVHRRNRYLLSGRPRTPYLVSASSKRASNASARAAVSTLTVKAAISGSFIRRPRASRKVRAR